MKRVYLDHAATTPLLTEAKEAMAAWLDGRPANASSVHASGRKAKDALDMARETFSSALGCLFGEVVFCSSGTEACNLAIVGSALGHQGGRKRILLGATEHHAVLNTAPMLERLGFQVQLIPVRPDNSIDPQCLADHMGDDVLLVSAMAANNETGVLNDIVSLSSVAHRWGALVHIDAVQTFPHGCKVDLLGADLLSLAAHKFNGPQGFGALYVQAGWSVAPLAVGGGQEREMRAGTENVTACVGAAVACTWHVGQGDAIAKAKAVARDAFLKELGDEVVVTSPESPKLSGHAHVRFPGIDNESLLIRLDRMGVEASAGAACSSGSIEPSHVLLACGWTEAEAREAVRFTFGHETSIEDAIWAAGIVRQAVQAVRTAK